MIPSLPIRSRTKLDLSPRFPISSSRQNKAPPRAHAICLPIAPSVTCDDGPCFGIGYTEYTVTWADQSNCGCDEIKIYVESGCSGGWVLEATVDCSDTSYSVCLPSNTDHRFKIVYLLNDVQKVGDIISDCVDCP